ASKPCPASAGLFIFLLGSRGALASGTDHAATGRAGSNEKLDGISAPSSIAEARAGMIAWPSNAVYSLTRRSQRPLVAEFVQKSSGLFKKQQLTGLFCERDARNGRGRSKPRVLRPRLLHFDREERSLPCSPPWC